MNHKINVLHVLSVHEDLFIQHIYNCDKLQGGSRNIKREGCVMKLFLG